MARHSGGSRYYQGPATGHFDGHLFFNPDGEGPRGFADLLRWRFGGHPTPWPARYPSPFAADRPPARVDRGLRVSFVGHASFLVQAAGLNVLTDPVWSDRASPFSFAGPRRHNPPGILFDDLPPINAVLVSHCHYDHMDLATLSRLWQRDRPRIVVPLGNDAIIRAHDPGIEVTAADWGDAVQLGLAARAWLEPAHHWSARGVADRNHALWCAFVLEAPGSTVYFAGDTGFGGGKHFAQAAAQHPKPDVALLPIGAYEPRWFMAPQHMNPADAVQAFQLLGATQALGCHWGTFRLTDEGADQPARDLETALGHQGVPPERFLAVRPGQVWTAPAV